MNLQRTTLAPLTRTDNHKTVTLKAIIEQLPYLIICMSLGIVGGGIGVALAIGSAVLIQTLFYASTVFLPNVPVLTIVAVLVGLSASWLLSRLARRLMPNFRYNMNAQGLQVILIASALTSLLENYLFLHNLSLLGIPTNAVWVNMALILQAIR
jgi:hypothetical protein